MSGTATVYWQSALSTSAQVGIGLAGFSGIIAALRSGGGSWNEADRLNLQVLLGASGLAVLFSILPFIVLDAVPIGLAWNILSFVYAGVFLCIGIWRLMQYRRGTVTRATVRRIAIGLVGMSSLLLANGCFFGAPWLYVSVVVWQLGNAFLSFVRLLQLEGGTNDGAA